MNHREKTTVTPCPVCRRRLPEVPDVCEPCRAGLTRTLATIPSLTADATARAAATHQPDEATANDPVSQALPAGPVPPTVYNSRTSGGPVEAPAPIDLDYIDIGPAANPLTDWAHRWHQPGDPPTHDVIGWLAAHLDRACDHHGDQVAEFAHDLRRYAAQLRRAAHDNRQLIGHCPTEDCGTELYAGPADKATTCTVCGTGWPRRHWLWLADTLRTAA